MGLQVRILEKVEKQLILFERTLEIPGIQGGTTKTDRGRTNTISNTCSFFDQTIVLILLGSGFISNTRIVVLVGQNARRAC